MSKLKLTGSVFIVIFLSALTLEAQTCTYTPYTKSFSGAIPAGANLVANGGFESGDFDSWFNDPNEDAEMTGSASKSGEFGLRAFSGQYKFKTQQQILDLAPNENYELKFWMRSYSGSPYVNIHLWYQDNTGAWQTIGNTYYPSSTWQEYTISVNTPALCANNYQIRIEMERNQHSGIHLDDLELIATGSEFSSVNHPIPPVQTDVFFEDFNNAENSGILNPEKWSVIRKQWSVGHQGPNNGVVPENLELTGNSILFKGHGDQYTGPVEGIGGNTRVGSIIATKDYYASGRYEVRAKLAPVGVCTAFWTYHYIEDEYDSQSPGTEIKNTEIDWEFPGDNNGPNSLREARCNTWGGLCNGWTGEYSGRGDLFDAPTVNSIDDLMNEYHVYRIDWHTGGNGEIPRIEWYIDDVLVQYYDHNTFGNDENNVGFRAARFWVGVWYSSWSGLPDHDEVACEVDWVRITPFNEPNDVYENETVPSDGIAGTCYHPVYPLEVPEADFSASSLNACTNESIRFTSTSTGSIDSYNWNFGSNAIPESATGNGPHDVLFTSPGDKTISLTVSGAGGTDSEIKNNYIKTQNTPTTSPISGNNVQLCNALNQTYSVDMNEGSSYNWGITGGASIVSGQGTHTISVDFTTNNATLTVTESISPTCIGSPQTMEIEVCLTSLSVTENPYISVQPNPFVNGCVLSMKKTPFSYNYEVYTISGRLIEKKSNIQSNTYIIGEQLDPGIYILRINNATTNFTQRIIKH